MEYEWNDLDEAAAREANALANAPRYHHHPTPRKYGTTITKDQAIWDEHLEIRYSTCTFCGRTLEWQDDPSHRYICANQTADVCNACLFLADFLSTCAPARFTHGEYA